MKRTPTKKSKYINQLYNTTVFILFLILSFFGVLAIGLSATNSRNQILNRADMTLDAILREYYSIQKNFSSVYLPIFEDNEIYKTLQSYFDANFETPLGAKEKKELVSVLTQLIHRDNRIAWIGLYSPNRTDNYYLCTDSVNLMEMEPDFPYMESLRSKRAQMEFFAAEPIRKSTPSPYTFTICGGLPQQMNGGALLVGYYTANLTQIVQQVGEEIPVRYGIVSQFGMVFDSFNRYEIRLSEESIQKNSTFLTVESPQKSYIKSVTRFGGTCQGFYSIPKKELFFFSFRNTQIIVLLLLAFALFSWVLYLYTMKKISKRVSVIQQGLDRIGNKDLNFRLSINGFNDEFEKISASINKMTSDLQNNMEREYLYSLRQKEAELSELQSKFHPHFLYNSLELIRKSSYQNGDWKTAETIKQLSSIFRKFIGGKHFVTLQEEISFCSSYLALFKARVDDALQIQYDFDTELLSCGIIRNLLQPIIENYFVHGFDPHNNCNHILISGHFCSDSSEYIQLQVADNGLGVTPNQIATIQEILQQSHLNGEKNYGLSNLSKRIQLFYGSECYLSFGENPDCDKGTCTTLKIKKMTCEEHEDYFQQNASSYSPPSMQSLHSLEP